MEFDKLIKERHCVRSFKTTKKPDYREIISAIESATKAPLAGNIEGIKYILVSDKDKIHELAKAAQQNFISQVDYVVVVCSDIKDLKSNYYERSKMYIKQEAGAAIENLFLKVIELGLATCWVGAFSDETIRRILKIPDNIDIECLLPIGYELSKSKQKKKPELDDVLFFDEWKNRFMKPRNIILGSKT